MYTSRFKLFMGLIIAILVISLAACSSSKKMEQITERPKIIAPALSPTGRLIQFVQTGEPYFLNGIFNDSVLNRMSINEMVQTRKDFVRSFGSLVRAEGPDFDSDTTATVVLFHESMTIAANILFDENGLIKDIKINQDLGDGVLGSY